MKLFTKLSGIICVLALSACGVISTKAAMGNPDKMFVMDAAFGSNAEIAASQLALKNSKNSDVRTFAEQMVADHTRATEKLKPIAMEQGLTLPGKPDPTHCMMGEHLEMVSPALFDKEYAGQMVADHAMVVSKFEHASKAAADSKIKAFATEMLPTLKHHWQMAKDLEVSLK